MHLSSVYLRNEWGIVYHTQPDSEQVEMVKELFFTSEQEAWTWFHSRYNMHEFVQVEVVRFLGFNKMELVRPAPKTG